MSQRQAIQIPLDHNTSFVLEWYVLRGAEITHSRERKTRKTIFKLREQIAKAISWFVTIILKLFRRIVNIGKSEVDIDRIETSHDYHLGMRIGSMNR